MTDDLILTTITVLGVAALLVARFAWTGLYPWERRR